jgi:two-component system sensor histidine kinase RpfC
MGPEAEMNRTGAIGRLMTAVGRRLRDRPDSEHEQAIVRVVIVTALLAYFHGLVAWEAPLPPSAGALLVWTAVIYLTFSFIHIALIVAWPRKSPARRLISAVTDFAALLAVLRLGGEYTAPLYPIYLWVTLGFGFRYGLLYLVAATIGATASFAVVLMTTDWWLDKLPMGFGLLAALVAIPAYSATLIKKLTEAKAQAEEANQAKNRFLARMSHELRTPLNAVIGISDLLSGTPMDRDQREMVRTVKSSGRALLSLIEGILDFSRIEANKVSVIADDFDLHAAIVDLVAILRIQADRRGLVLGVDVSPRVPYALRGDWPHLQQILTNLIGNAIKFTEHGHVLLRVGLAGPETPDAARLRFEVIDSGIGIAPEQIDTIFDSFTQADEGVNRRNEGVGLGLAISKHLTELLGGRIGVQTALGKGSTFWVEVPLARQAATVSTLTAPDLAVLVVSRDTSMVESIRHGLATLHMDVIGVSSPFEAQSAAAGAMRGAASPIVLIDARDAGWRAADVAHSLETFRPSCTFAFVQIKNPLQGPSADGVFLCSLDVPFDAQALTNATHLAGVFIAIRSGTEAAERELGITRSAGRSLSILVAEDNQVNRMVTEKILARAGHRPTLVVDGDEALDVLEEGTFDLAIVDVNMPGTSGIDVVKLYRLTHLGEAYMPIVGLSADATAETRRACEEAGMDRYLTKPVSARKLLAEIEAVVAAHGRPAEEPESTPAPTAAVTEIFTHPRFKGETAPAIDRMVIDDLESLGPGGEFLPSLVREFLADAARLATAMRMAAVRGDARSFRENGHALRSSSANVGAKMIHQYCQQFSGITPDELRRSGAAHVARIDDEIERYRRAIAAYLAERAENSEQR